MAQPFAKAASNVSGRTCCSPGKRSGVRLESRWGSCYDMLTTMKKTLLLILALVGLGLFATPKAEAGVSIGIGLPVPFVYPYPYAYGYPAYYGGYPGYYGYGLRWRLLWWRLLSPLWLRSWWLWTRRLWPWLLRSRRWSRLFAATMAAVAVTGSGGGHGRRSRRPPVRPDGQLIMLIFNGRFLQWNRPFHCLASTGGTQPAASQKALINEKPVGQRA